MSTSSQHSKPKEHKKTSTKVLNVVLVVCLALAVAGVALIVYRLFFSPTVQPSQTTEDTTPVPTVAKVNNPIDFASLQSQNPDVYAWITIPNTNIDYPICQNSTDDAYYLDHNAEGDYSRSGAIYTETLNTKTFNDPVTVVYGHYAGEDMFTELHYFENKDFFDANEYFTIYMPYHVLTYRVVSAYQYDDRHILNSFDFLQPSVKRSYFDMVCNPQSMLKNVRDGITLSDNDRIVQLSTCMNLYSLPQRYIVTGVLVDDQAAER